MKPIRSVTIAVAAATSAAVWALSPWAVGAKEPWDVDSPYYWLALAIAGCVAGALAPRPLWAHYVSAVLGQALYQMFVPARTTSFNESRVRVDPKEARMNVSLLCAVFAWVLCFTPLRATAQPNDADLIRELQTQQADAWNRHDAAAYASLFTADGDVVNVLGWWWKTPAEIRSKLDDAFAFVFRDSTLTITDVQIRFLQPTIAVAHVWWTMEGAKAPPGAPAPPRHGVQLQILSKQSGRWLIASFQNTNSIPEMPFPKGPAAAKS